MVGGALSLIAGLELPFDGSRVPRLVSVTRSPKEWRSGDQIVAEIFDELADSRLDVHAILTTVTKTLSRLRPGTWVAALMNKDPSTSHVVAADDSEPGLAGYVERYMSSLYGPDRTPTTGLAQRVIASGSPLFMPGLSLAQFLALLPPASRTYMAENPPPAEVGSLGLLIVPMRARGATIGTIGVIERAGAQPPTEGDAAWLQSVADRTGVAIENAQLYDDAVRRLERLSSLQSASRAIAASSDLTFTLKVILDQVTSRLEVDAADVLLLDHTDGSLMVAASTGFLSTSMPDYRLLVGEGLPGRAVAHRRTELTNALDDFAHSRRRSLFAREGFTAHGAVPLFAGANLVGVLEIFHRSAMNPDDESLSYLDAIGSIAAIAIDSSIVKDRLRAADGSHRPAATSAAPDMTRVERQILSMLVEGLTNREISGQVHLSQNTVKFHVRRLLEKAKTANRTELARKATQEGWL